MKKVLLALLMAVTLLMPLDGWARTYGVKLDKATPEAAIAALKHETGLEFVYQKDLLTSAKSPVTCSYTGLNLDQLLNRVLSIQMMLGYEVVDNTVVLKRPDLKVDFVRGDISGIVYDIEENEPLAGATIMIDGTTNITVTDADGRFAFKDVKALNPVVSALFVGMKPMSVKVTPKNQKDIRFDLETQATMISEVIVTGYGDVKKEKMTGSTVTLSADKLEDRHMINVLDNLEGRVAGLSTYGGKPVIRGVGTLRASSNPLLVVDGVPVESDLDDLNPYNIESINVLKDAAASAIYGARAANGIIVVTTKNAKKKGKIDIDFSSDITWYENKNMDYHDNFYLTPAEHIDKEKEYYEYKYFVDDPERRNIPAQNIMMMNMYTAIGYLDPTPVEWAYYQLATGQITRDELDATIAPLYNNNYAQDYADAIYKRQVVQQYNLALRSSSDRSRNNVVLNYKHDNVGTINHKDDWLNISYRGSYDVAKWLTATLSINSIYSNTRAKGPDQTSYSANPFMRYPYYSFYNEDGSVHRQYAPYSGNGLPTEDPIYKDLSENPIDEFYNNTMENRRQDMRYHADLLFKIIPGLTANAQFIYEIGNQEQKWVLDADSHPARVIYNAYTTKNGNGEWEHLTPDGGMMQSMNVNTNAWTARGQVNYSKTFGKHDIAAIAGLEFRENLYKGTKTLLLGYDDQLQQSSTMTVNLGTLSTFYKNPNYMAALGGYPSQQFAYSYLSGGIGLVPEQHHRFGSGYANLTYTYDEKYNVFGSFRKDYADVLGLDTKFRGKPLWSVGAGWNIHNEEFMHDYAAWLNFLKIRFSYGVTGNIYQGATSFMTAQTGLINEYTTAPYGQITSPANPNLRWEQNRTTNVGLDYSFLNYRLRGSIDFYNKVGKDIFNPTNLDPTSGFTTMVANVASIRNRGIEVSAAYDWFVPRARQDFQWTTSVTFTYNKNVVTDVENDAVKAGNLISIPYKTGYPVSTLWSYRFAGISDNIASIGQPLYYKDNDGGTSTSAYASPVDVLEFSGQSDPKYIVGMDNTWKWNGLSLTAVLAYYGGHKMRAISYDEQTTDYSNPKPSWTMNSWTPENPTDYPGQGQYGASGFYGYLAPYSNRSVRDASFLKLRSLTLGYTLPEAMTRRWGINLVQFRFQVNNPKALWTANHLGVDPETLGIRRQASYTAGLNLNF